MESHSSAGHPWLVDLDGTLADYHKAMREGLSAVRGPDEEDFDWAGFSREVPPHIEARMDLIKRQPGFWSGLARIEDGFSVLSLIIEAGFSPTVLTKGPKSKKTSRAWTEKVEWCHDNLPDVPVNVVSKDKGGVYGRGLFDDYPAYIMAWLEHRPRGRVLMLDQPWNQEFFHPRVTRIKRPFVGEELIEPVRKILLEAKNR